MYAFQSDIAVLSFKEITMRKQNAQKMFVYSTALVLFVVSITLYAEDKPKDVVKYRQNMMKATSGYMGAIAAIIKDKIDRNDQLIEHARAVQALSKDIAKLFPPGSKAGRTRARGEVWENRPDFEQAANDAELAANEFAVSVTIGDADAYKTKFKDLAGTCKACHKDFRKKKKRKK